MRKIFWLIFIISFLISIVVFLYLANLYQHKGLTKVEIFQGENEKATFFVKLARTPEEHQRGLMFIERLPKNEGMLFVFEDETSRSFWMKNTLIPLDMVFFDKDFLIVDIVENAAPCQKDPCPSYQSKTGAKYVLEINSGLVKEKGLEIGDELKTGGI